MRNTLHKLVLVGIATFFQPGCVTSGTFEQYQITVERQRTETQQRYDAELQRRDEQANERENALRAEIAEITSRLNHGAFQRDDDFYVKTTEESRRIAQTAITRTEELDAQNQTRISESLTRNDQAVAALQSTVSADISTLTSETRAQNDELTRRVNEQLAANSERMTLLEQQLRERADELAAGIAAKEQELEGKLGTLSTEFRAQIDTYNQTIAAIRSDLNANMNANSAAIAQIQSDTRQQNERITIARQETVRTIADVRELQQRVNDVLGDPVARTGIYQDRALAQEERAKLAAVRQTLYRAQLSDQAAGQLFTETREAGETFWTQFNDSTRPVADRRQALTNYLNALEQSARAYTNSNGTPRPESEK